MQEIHSNILHYCKWGKNMIGIVKEIDNLGRIVIPKEIRDAFKLTKEVEIILTEDGILIRNPQYVIIKKCSDTH